MTKNLFTCLFLSFANWFTITGYAQETNTSKERVQSLNGFFAIQAGIPSEAMQKAIKNNMGNLGFGAGFALLSNPFTWGKNKRNSPIRIGGETGYTYYGRFLSDVTINGYHGDYKTSYGILQLNALLQLRPAQEEPVTPFVEILAGGSFYISRIKENLNLIETAIGIETFDLDSYSSASFNKGIAVGCYLGNYQKKDSPRFTIRVSYNRGNHIKYIVRNSLIYNSGNGRLEYEVDRAPVSYFMVQLGIGR